MLKFNTILSLSFLFFISHAFGQAPNAQDDYDTASINTTLNVPAPGVLVNDTSPSGSPLSVVSFLVNGMTFTVGNTANFAEGSLTIFADGSFVFVPAAGYTGDVPVITYTITDGSLTNSADLFLTVEEITDLIEIDVVESCNQGFDTDGNYGIRYTVSFLNTSTARDYHAPNLIGNIDFVHDLDVVYGNGCVIEINEITVSTTVVEDFIDDPYPLEFNNASVNPDFLAGTSNNIFSTTSINNAILYPRQSVVVSFCVVINPFCNGRPNPTPSGSGIDFDAVFDISTSIGNDTNSLILSDFHTTEGILTAGFFVPETDPEVNSDGTYDFTNSIVIENQGSGTANNINYNLGIGNFLDNGLLFNTLTVNQVSGPPVTLNPAYDGDVNTTLLLGGNNLAPGETIILEVFSIIAPTGESNDNTFRQLSISQTQGGLDGFDETTANARRSFSFVTWEDNLGDHLDRYYIINSISDPLVNNQCACRSARMNFLFVTSSNSEKTIASVNNMPNGILEQQEITFNLTITNTSTVVELTNLQLEENLSNICVGNLVSFSAPSIVASTAATDPTLNVNFDGTTDVNIFDGTSGVLMAGQSLTVALSVIFSEDCFGMNTINFSATDPLGTAVNSSTDLVVEAFTDSDNDGVSNVDDIDDDNDTILDLEETNGLDPLDDDDLDLIPNYRDTDFGSDNNNDGVVDIFDFDSDGVPNHLDLDNDNDGIYDITEVGNQALDTNGNGRTNNPVGLNGLDNTIETNDNQNASVTYTIINTDGNGNPDYIDIDSDADGIVDNIEAQATDAYVPPNNIVTENGMDTAYTNGLVPVDTDGDTIFDYVDSNSDDDLREDFIEGWDFNNDGVPETIASGLDNDNDGLDDGFDNDNTVVNSTNGQVPTDFPNVDNPSFERDWREIRALLVVVNDVSEVEGSDFIFTFALVTAGDNPVAIVSATPIEMTLSTSDGTDSTNVLDVAVAPFDYSEVNNQSITIPAFTETFTFTLTSFDDTIKEQDELFTLNAVITSNNAVNDEAMAIGTIIDNDPTPDISMIPLVVDEGGTLDHTINLSNPSSSPITIEISTTDDTAIAPDDYNAVNTSLTIEGTIDPMNANLEATFGIATLEDNLNEPDEEYLIVNGAVITGNVNNPAFNVSDTIIDIDPNPLISVTDFTVVEGGNLEFEISLTNPNGGPLLNSSPINFNLETSDISTTASQDYPFIATTAAIPALATSYTQFVPTIDDNLNEETETMNLVVTLTTVEVANSSSTLFGLGTIKDNDFPNLFSPNGDGRSDVFRIAALKDFPEFKMIIFDRWGSEIFTYNNNGNPNPNWWDGTLDGKPVVEGVYFYELDFNDGTTPPKTGFIQLIR